MEHFEGIESYSVKHLPIVKVYAERLGLVELVNHLVPSHMELPPGVFFLGMVLDTLSGRNLMYRLEHFFEERATELLLGKEVDANSFNDVNVGPFLIRSLIFLGKCAFAWYLSAFFTSKNMISLKNMLIILTPFFYPKSSVFNPRAA